MSRNKSSLRKMSTWWWTKIKFLSLRKQRVSKSIHPQKVRVPTKRTRCQRYRHLRVWAISIWPILRKAHLNLSRMWALSRPGHLQAPHLWASARFRSNSSSGPILTTAPSTIPSFWTPRDTSWTSSHPWVPSTPSPAKSKMRVSRTRIHHAKIQSTAERCFSASITLCRDLTAKSQLKDMQKNPQRRRPNRELVRSFSRISSHRACPGSKWSKLFKVRKPFLTPLLEDPTKIILSSTERWKQSEISQRTNPSTIDHFLKNN